MKPFDDQNLGWLDGLPGRGGFKKPGDMVVDWLFDRGTVRP